MAPDFREAFKRQPSSFADPCPQYDLVTVRRRSFVVDLVPQNDPADGFLRVLAGYRAPVRGGNLLHPAKVNGVVHVILLVDVIRQN